MQDSTPPPPGPRTPLMQQYFGAREEHPGVILLMRVGDFYEAYGEDAVAMSEILNITLTAREDGGQKTAMAGVPHHAAERYVARLVQAGRRVAIMDQVEDPKQARGLVKRRVTRVVSRGTVFEDALLDSRSNNYLVAAVVGDPVCGLGVVDITTGEFLATEIDGDARTNKLLEEIARLEPAEVLLANDDSELADTLRQATGAQVTPYEPRDGRRRASAHDALVRHFGTHSLRGFGCEDYTSGLEAAALVLEYLRETQVAALAHITAISTYSTRDHMLLDSAARRNLELTTSLTEGGRLRTVLGVIDETLTAMGGRLIRRRLEEPLLDVGAIDRRLDAVAELVADDIRRGDIREGLRGMNDIERLVSRASAGMANARDLVGLREALNRLPQFGLLLDTVASVALQQICQDLTTTRSDPSSALAIPMLREHSTRPVAAGKIAELLERGLQDDPPTSLREGNLIREGFSDELDALRHLAREGRTWIADLEARERARTGITSLKVGYNAVFGYYIEVTRANLAKVPEDYIRKQTTASGERYITPELKEYESRVLGADEKGIELEYTLFVDLRERVAEASADLLALARSIAELDLYAGLAESAVRNRYVRPVVNDGDVIEIRAGRHAVVERIMGSAPFVPNDCLLDCGENQVHIITGPNMSGKSTALRQVALITLLAQVGAFVPADSATIGLVDRIFTRVGAHDELASGQSTFMVEMNETATILNNATPRSLVILDEIGRGTSTYDGLSIAWAVAEHLARLGARTMFATHYHHLNELARQQENVRNYRVAVKEQGDHILWLHRLVPGGTDRSYGIQVARMAGVPPTVIARAKEVLAALEKGSKGARDLGKVSGGIEATTRRLQLTLFEAERHPVLDDLEALDLTALSPIEALIKLDELQRKIRET